VELTKERLKKRMTKLNQEEEWNTTKDNLKR
jgi:hypothetical protein